MNGTLELTPDNLAQLVCDVLEMNGLKADGLALYLNGQLVGYDRVVIHVDLQKVLKIYPPPQQGTTGDRDWMLRWVLGQTNANQVDTPAAAVDGAVPAGFAGSGGPVPGESQ